MAVYKCKMCGGTLDVKHGATVCECEYCGSKQTVPQLDDEKKINLFMRANRLRQANEFDKASVVYESIVSEFPDEPEAYWGLILCKYGIEYVDDPETGKKIPTCNRSSFDSIFDDQNFDMVMEYSDPSSRAVYRDEAKSIEGLRVGIIEVSSREEPYDIFICYKETDAMGGRTLDSVLAQDVYSALVEKGYRVFFSRITLEDKLGQEYEPYIFAALNSAKLMLVFGTDYEYFNAVWVKNEWSRFLSLIEKGAKKTLIPCFKGIDANDMPKEFARLQAQDMGKIGAIQDLLRGVEKILGTKSQIIPSEYPTLASVNVSGLTQRGNMALEDGDFENAVNYFERALDANPSEARAYLGIFLATNGFTSLENLLEDDMFLLEENKEFKRAEQFADSILAKELKTVRDHNSIINERRHLIDVFRKIEEKKAAHEAMLLLSQCTDASYNEALGLFDLLLDNKCINAEKCRSYKEDALTQFTTLKYLRDKMEVCSQNALFPCERHESMLFNKLSALDVLVAEGLIEEHPTGYCWPQAMKVKTDVETITAPFINECDSKVRDIQKKVDESREEARQKKDDIQRQISDLQRQKSSLGFLKVKEKKLLQAQIDDAQKQLLLIPSDQAIRARYQLVINEINVNKQLAIKKATDEVKTKYRLLS